MIIMVVVVTMKMLLMITTLKEKDCVSKMKMEAYDSNLYYTCSQKRRR